MQTTNNDTTTTGQAAFDRRQYLEVHPAADEYPLLREIDPAGFQALVDDVRANGMRTRLIFWMDGTGNELLIEGRSRLDVLAEIGALAAEHDRLVFVKTWTGKEWIDDGNTHLPVLSCGEHLDVGDPFAIAESYNLHRRHLTPKERRDRIEAAIKRNPEKSDRTIGAEVGADHKTVGTVRARGEDVGSIPHVEKRTDTRGRKQPAKRARAAVKQAETKVETDDLDERDCEIINAKLAELFVVDDDGITRLRDGLPVGHKATPTSADIKEARSLAYGLGISLFEREDGVFVLDYEDEDGLRLFRDLLAVCVYLVVIKEAVSGKADPKVTSAETSAETSAAEAKEKTTTTEAALDGAVSDTRADTVIAFHNLLSFESRLPAELDVWALAAFVREGEATVEERGRVRRVLDFARRLSEALDEPSPPSPSSPDGEDAAEPEIEEPTNTASTQEEPAVDAEPETPTIGDSTDAGSDSLEDDEYEEPEPERKRRPVKMIPREDILADAVGGAVEELSELAMEVRDVVDNAPENLQQSERIQTLGNTADELERIEAPDVPDILGKIAVTYSLPKRRYMSRASRASDAIVILEACKDTLWGIPEDDARHAEAQELADNLNDIVDIIDCCEFPGMRG